ncbi:HlyD family type I secretion periplasmic adaptor subunit [Endozoicomonas lisbonensis]|uniref:Membrane fusion protein (MFP) family protein n=1 Tax=Endozoicomonas lisbonensis TaxID=3120522 RepID=A0ABV2SJB6_9GAMM
MAKYLKKWLSVFSSKEENDFLPASVEILETPASPLKHVLTVGICMLFVIAFLWSWFGKIDVIVEAEGRIIPDGYSKKISPIQVARVEKVYVKEGSIVQKGDTLIELMPNPSDMEANTQQPTQDIISATLSVLRQETLLAIMNNPERLALPVSIDLNQEAVKKGISFSSAPSPQRWAAENSALKSELEAFLSSDLAMDKNIEELASTLVADNEELTRLKLLSPIHDKLAASSKALYDKKMMSEVDWLIRREKQIDTAQQLKVMTQRHKEHQARYQSLLADKQQKRQAFISQHLREYLGSIQQIDHASLIVSKAQQREKNQILTAPIDGIVQQIQIHSTGDVVQPGQPVMVIVPLNSKLIVEAMVQNKDIRWIEPQQKVQIKLESFPYTRYGYLDGIVDQISGDAINDEQKGWFYQVYINLDRDWFQIEHKKIKVQPGMTLTADVIVSYRRLLEYFLSPLLRYQKEVFRETM